MLISLKYLATLLEDVAVSTVVITRCAGFGVHIRHVVWRHVPIERRPIDKKKGKPHLHTLGEQMSSILIILFAQ